MDMGLKGRVAIVTGASAGIGLAIAEELVQNGASVVLVARGAARLKAVASTLTDDQRRVLPVVFDVAAPEAAQSIVDQAFSTFGRIDVLVNNAGRAQTGGLMESTEENWAEMTSVKLTAMRRLCKAVIPHMRRQHWGRIVNMSSIGGIYPNPKLLISHVLSAAINNFTKAVALEVAADGILVNAVGSGAVATANWANNMIPAVRHDRPAWAALPDDDVLAKISAELTPVGRAAHPREIAAIAAFLASDRNGFITGDTIEASGGADRFM